MAIDRHFRFIDSFALFVHIQVKIVFKEDKLYSGLQWYCHTHSHIHTGATPMALRDRGVQSGSILGSTCMLSTERRRESALGHISTAVAGIVFCVEGSVWVLYAVLDLPSSSLIASMSSSFSLDSSFLISSRMSCFNLS